MKDSTLSSKMQKDLEAFNLTTEVKYYTTLANAQRAEVTVLMVSGLIKAVKSGFSYIKKSLTAQSMKHA